MEDKATVQVHHIRILPLFLLSSFVQLPIWLFLETWTRFDPGHLNLVHMLSAYPFRLCRFGS